ncbi:MAG: hypothetical protein ACRENO_06925, partial [Thermodesulfobacteriota bacterium]
MLFIALYLFLQTDKCREFVRKSIEDAVSYTPNFQFRIGELSGNLFSNIEIKNAEITIGGETFIKAERISTSYSIPLILSVITRGDIPLYNTEVDGIEVYIVKGKDGRWNYQKIRDGEKREYKEQVTGKEKKRSKFSLFLKNNKANSGSVKIISEENDSVLEFKIAAKSLFSINLIEMNKRFEIDAYNVNIDWLPKNIRFRKFRTDALLSG